MSDTVLRQHLLYVLDGGGAHLNFDKAIDSVPVADRGKKVDGNPHTLWSLLEHMRICQWDILEFSRNAEHVSPKFPEGCWPQTDTPPHPQAWDQCIAAFKHDLDQMKALVDAPETDLFAKIPHGDGQTILREAILVADHNAYHLGQFVFLRRCLGNWHPQ